MKETNHYLQIIIEGYCDNSNRKYLSDYFTSKFKSAEKESFVSANLFFEKCIGVVDALKHNIEWQYEKRKHELNRLYNESIKLSQTDESKDYKEIIEQQKYNLDSFDLSSVQVHWGGIKSFTGTACQIKINDIEIIRNAITEAWRSFIPLEKDVLPYKSFTRAIAIYYVILDEKGIITLPDSKEGVYALAKGFYKPNGEELGGVSLYQTLKTGKDSNKAIFSYKAKELEKIFPEDYYFALSLYHKKHN